MMLFVITIINKFKYFTIKIDRGSEYLFLDYEKL